MNWLQCKSFPAVNSARFPSRLSNLVRLKNEEFVVVPLITDAMLESSNNDGIYKYNATENAFDLFIKFDEDISYNFATISYDSKTNKLYIFQSAPSFYIIDINTESITEQICTMESLSEGIGIRSELSHLMMVLFI